MLLSSAYSKTLKVYVIHSTNEKTTRRRENKHDKKELKWKGKLLLLS